MIVWIWICVWSFLAFRVWEKAHFKGLIHLFSIFLYTESDMILNPQVNLNNILTLRCCRSLICLSLFIFHHAKRRTVFWIWVFVDGPLLALLLLLPGHRPAAAYWGRCRRGGWGWWGGDAGSKRCERPVGLLAWTLPLRVNGSLGGVWLSVPMPLSF